MRKIRLQKCQITFSLTTMTNVLDNAYQQFHFTNSRTTMATNNKHFIIWAPVRFVQLGIGYLYTEYEKNRQMGYSYAKQFLQKSRLKVIQYTLERYLKMISIKASIP